MERVRIGGEVMGQGHALAIDETQILNVGRAETVGIQAWLDCSQALG